MNALVNEWIGKAEADYHSAWRDYRARKFPNYDGAGFHAQQRIEKYLKGFLIHCGQPSLWGHDLLAIVEKCLPFFPELELEKPVLALLTKFAVRYRYPGESASKTEAHSALPAMKQLRKLLRDKFGLPTI
jgi:HEPN domain-containing protein